jgi:hypothetical protein
LINTSETQRTAITHTCIVRHLGWEQGALRRFASWLENKTHNSEFPLWNVIVLNSVECILPGTTTVSSSVSCTDPEQWARHKRCAAALHVQRIVFIKFNEPLFSPVVYCVSIQMCAGVMASLPIVQWSLPPICCPESIKVTLSSDIKIHWDSWLSYLFLWAQMSVLRHVTHCLFKHEICTFSSVSHKLIAAWVWMSVLSM